MTAPKLRLYAVQNERGEWLTPALPVGDKMTNDDPAAPKVKP